ncbi:MAG: hypothetical protein A2021_03975 [Elusimicrobia bacterium GWF2_52_66]|nr:MAG: hypothetical protein A2X33_09645 [Elusimicrobia bacterium GWA2_51_34]OGR88419.1 MAG: hypothetical protein A2021_03975 [Elusimicrobia bacterium GWF2_52_66]HAF95024.1 hypothetical protein [Elusimicrobiota bacterium]HCE97959.1 hypothetical protein [Elusimicrobiota bacterium]
MAKSLIILMLLLAPGMVFAADELELNKFTAADVMTAMRSIPVALPVPSGLIDAAQQPLPAIKIFCSRRDVSLWGKVTGQGAALGFKIWDPDIKNGGYLARIPSQTKLFKYAGSDESGQIKLTLYIPSEAFQLAKNEKFASIIYALGDGNDTADKYNLDCVIK